MPRLWLSYLTLFVHPSCPSALSHTHARRTFDRALRTLPPSLHERIWHLYLSWASPSSPASPSASTIVHVWRRYLERDPSPTSHYIRAVLLALDPHPRPLEAAKRLLALARLTHSGQYKHPTGAAGEFKSAHQLVVEWLDVCERFPDEVGVDAAESERLRDERASAASASGTGAGAGALEVAAPANGATEGAKKGSAARTELPPLDAATLDPTSPAKLDVDHLVRTHGLALFGDQAGRLWTGLATYWIKRGEFALARATFDEALGAVVTLRDFTQVFDAYAEFEESYISGLMEAVADADDDDEDKKDDEDELDERMRAFEDLMDRRPFLVNEVLLRRNPNDVQEWEKRVALYGTDDEKVRPFLSFLLERLSLSSQSRAPADVLSSPHSHRSPRRTRSPPPRSTRARPSARSTSSGSTLPSSTSRAARRARPTATSRARARCLRRPSGSRSGASTSSQRCGASGQRWRCGTSASLPSLSSCLLLVRRPTSAQLTRDPERAQELRRGDQGHAARSGHPQELEDHLVPRRRASSSSTSSLLPTLIN